MEKSVAMYQWFLQNIDDEEEFLKLLLEEDADVKWNTPSAVDSVFMPS